MSELVEGQMAPDFTLVDQNNKEHRLSDYRGKAVVLYFYPRDDTPGCTKEACNFRDDYSAYEDADAVILGVSPDDADSHTKFIQKFDLPFTLLADSEHNVSEAYGVWGPKKLFGKEYLGVKRWTFLIAPDGKIAKIFANVKPAEHSEKVLKVLETI
ncbi:MAG: thioredoxin-dependent thiol peroxidase [Anaerolineae bacterium]|nr:thioredoxin-dependent thiol peroxidase [Anaerolineae bacterium]